MRMRDSRTEDCASAAAIAFGLGGLIPFVGLAALSWFGPLSSRQDVMLMLAQYGAVIASFVGALHWGYAVRDEAQGSQAWFRYGWSVVPALVAWLSLQLEVASALRTQAVLLMVCVLVDRILARRLQLPDWLISLRYWLTAVGTVSVLAASFAG